MSQADERPNAESPRQPRSAREPIVPERVRPADVSRMTSLSVRKIQEMSAQGKIPSAAKLGGVWTYDPADIRKWIKEAERAALPVRSERRTSLGTQNYGRDYSKMPDATINALYEKLVGVKRKSTGRRGKPTPKV